MFLNPPFSGVSILVRPELLRSTRQVFECRIGGRPAFICWSLPIFRMLTFPSLMGFTFAAWHDERTNCPTWTDAAGCRCEVDP